MSLIRPPAKWGGPARRRLDRPRAHLLVDVVGLADLQRHDRQGRIGAPELVN